MRLTDTGTDNPVRRFEIGTKETPISGGLNTADPEYLLADNQSPRMKNVWFDGRTLSKRPGQRAVAAPPGEAELGAMIEFGGALYAVAGSKLYRFEEEFCELYDGIADSEGTLFRFGSAIYYLSKKEYLRCDGETVEAVEPYVPTIVINRPPDGEGGDLADNYNRLGGKFTNSFHGDGESTVYQLTDRGLDEGFCEVVVDGERLEGGWTADYTLGRVTFTSPPPKGTNNVEITVSKLDAELRDKLYACRVTANFGGTGGTRLFLAGGDGATYYYSELLDPSYFPDNNYNTVGSGGGVITGMAEQYGVLIVFLEREIWQVSYSYDGTADGRVSFPQRAVNRTIGCDAPGSIQLVNNSLVFLNSARGVHILLSTDIAEERNVQLLSRNINRGKDSPGLLDCEGLKDAVSLDWEGRYWLCVGERAFLWDYAASPYALGNNPDAAAKKLSWFYFDGIAAKGFAERAGELYFRYAGGLGQFDRRDFCDFEQPYEALWRMPIRHFNALDSKKTALELFVTMRTDTSSYAELRYITEQHSSGEGELQPVWAGSFSFENFRWDAFTFGVNNYFYTYRRRPRKRKSLYFAVEFRSCEPGRDLNISALALTYRVAKKIR